MLFVTCLLASLVSIGWTCVNRARLRSPRGRLWVIVPVAMAALTLLVSPDGYGFQKCIGHLLMPVGILWLALFALAARAGLRRERRRTIVLGALWLGFSLAGSDYVGERLEDWLEAPYRSIDPLSEKPFDAVFVMGGATSNDERGHVFLGSNGDRVLLAARLFHAGIAPRLVTSGSVIPGMSSRHNPAEANRLIWRSLRIPEEAILKVGGAHNTREEIRAYGKLTADKGWKRVGLLTSGWHLRRAMRQAALVGLEAVPLPAERGGESPLSDPLAVIPSGMGFKAVQSACWEILGALVRR